MPGSTKCSAFSTGCLKASLAETGYTAILVALLALNHPLRVMLVSIGLAALQVGAATMQRTLGIPSSIVSIIIGFIVLMILCGSLPQIWAENRPSQSVKKERGKHVG